MADHADLNSRQTILSEFGIAGQEKIAASEVVMSSFHISSQFFKIVLASWPGEWM